MNTLSMILNVIACGLSELLGTGRRGCSFDFRTARVLIFLDKSVKILPTETPNLLYFRNLAKKGKAIICNGVVDYSNDTPEDDMGTRANTGEMYLTLKHPYKWKFTFDSGLNYAKALMQLESNGQYDIMLMDEKGDLLLAKNSDGSARGLDLGLLNTGAYVMGNDNSISITVQVKREDFDRNSSYIESKSLDFQARDLEGFDNVYFQFAPVAPLATKLFLSSLFGDKSHFANDYINTNIRIKKSGVPLTISAINFVSNEADKRYEITIPATSLGEVYTAETFDAADSTRIILNPLGFLSKSNIATVTVV